MSHQSIAMRSQHNSAGSPLSSRRAQGGSSAASPCGSCASWCVCALSSSRLGARAMPCSAPDRTGGQVRTADQRRACRARRGAGGRRGLRAAVEDVARCRAALCHERAGCFSRRGAAIIARRGASVSSPTCAIKLTWQADLCRNFSLEGEDERRTRTQISRLLLEKFRKTLPFPVGQRCSTG